MNVAKPDQPAAAPPRLVVRDAANDQVAVTAATLWRRPKLALQVLCLRLRWALQGARAP